MNGILTEQANGWYYKHNLGDGKFSKATLFVTGENLFTLTNMIGFFDPELVFVAAQGGKNYPLNKVVSVGLILNL